MLAVGLRSGNFYFTRSFGSFPLGPQLGAAARAVARRICAGQVHINYPAWRPDAPFGGYKRSGNARGYGQFGFEEYLETKAVLGYDSRQTVWKRLQRIL